MRTRPSRRTIAAAFVLVVAVVAGGCRASREIRPPFIKEGQAPRGGLGGAVVFTSQPSRSSALFAIDPALAPAERRSFDVTPPGLTARSPAYAPGGRRLAFAANDGEQGAIAVMESSGGEPQILVRGLGLFDHPSWSPDGTRLAYARNSESSGSWNLYVLDVATGAETQLTSGPKQEWYPAWSPAGDRLAFTSDIDGDNAIWLIDVASGGLSKVVDSPRADEQPAWSPDGRRIVFTSDRELERWQLFVLDVDSGAERRLIRSETVDRFPSFSPDGRYVLVSIGYLAVYRADGGRFPDGNHRWKLTGRLVSGSATWSAAAGDLPPGGSG